VRIGGATRSLVGLGFVLSLGPAVGCKTVPTPDPAQMLRDAPATPPVAVEWVDTIRSSRSAEWGQFERLSAVDVLPDGRLFIADLGASTVHWFETDGAYAGQLDYPDERTRPADLAHAGFQLFVLDRKSKQLLRFNRDGAYRDVYLPLDELSVQGPIDPSAIAVDRDGRVAIADLSRNQVLLTTPFLELEVRVGEWGSFQGQLDEPRGVAFGRDGVLYVSDRGNRRVQGFDRTGLLLVASKSVDDIEPDLIAPTGLACDWQGNVFVADTGAGTVRVFSPDLQPVLDIGQEGPLASQLSRPVDCVVDGDGFLYVSDAGSGQVVVYHLVYP
jgi:DNA-binding beta-propeller fold protein YncE